MGDDPRIEWLRDRVYGALDVKENEVFDELLERDDGEMERCLGKFLNDSPEEGESSILFYKIVKEEEEEVEVECEPEIPDIEEEKKVQKKNPKKMSLKLYLHLRQNQRKMLMLNQQ